MNKKKSPTLYAFLTLAVMLSLGGILTAFSYWPSEEAPHFLPYDYAEYVDQSDNKIFSPTYGAQLYEAEKANQNRDFDLIDSFAASSRFAMRQEQNGEIALNVIAEEKGDAYLTLCLNYEDDNKKDAFADFLFSLYCNNSEIECGDARIPAAVNNDQYHEATLGLLSLNAGINQIRLAGKNIPFSLDYLLLTPVKERSANVNTIGKKEIALERTRKQIVEGEWIHLQKGQAAFGSDVCSNYHYVEIPGKTDYSFVLTSLERTSSSVSIYAWGEGEVDVKIGGEAYRVPLSNKRAKTSLGTIEFPSGATEVSLISDSLFQFDCLVFNEEIDFDPLLHENLFEAERGEISGSQIIEDEKASNGKAVGFNEPGTSFGISFLSRSIKRVHAILRMSNAFEDCSLGDALRVSYNGRYLDVSDVLLPHTGGYDRYIDVDIGEIALAYNENEFVFESLTGGYNFDALCLSDFSADESPIYEAEKAHLQGGCIVEENLSASEGHNVGYNSKDSSLLFHIRSSMERNAALTIACSLFADDAMLFDDLYEVTLNEERLSFGEALIAPTGSWIRFEENALRPITLKAGTNRLKFLSKGGSVNIDYLRFEIIHE